MRRQLTTPRGLATVEPVLDAGCELFSEPGLRATTLDRIEAASGAGRSQLSFFFTGNPDLVTEIVRRQARRLIDGQQPLLGSFGTRRGCGRYARDLRPLRGAPPVVCGVLTIGPK